MKPKDRIEADTYGRELAMLEHALKNGRVSFAHLAIAFYTSSPDFCQDPCTRKKFEDLFGRLLDGFESVHGRIVACHFCQKIIGAAAYTDTGELHIGHPVLDGGELEALLFRCERIGIEVRRVLVGDDRTAVLMRLYKIATWLLNILDASKDPETSEKDGLSGGVALLAAELKGTEEMYSKAAVRSANVTYFKGMLWGVIPIAIMTTAGLFIPEFPLALVVALVGGGAGAFVSVLSRMANTKLQVQFDAGDRLLRLLGSFRPLIGGIMGIAVATLFESGILPLELPSQERLSFFFFTVGFLAGFTERWAQDMLTGAQGRLDQSPTQSHNEKKVPDAAVTSVS